MSETAWFVIIEWDGAQPPGTWYNRMHRLAGKVRGDKEQSPLQRREDKGIIVQEGCIITKSESLARELALAADELGASLVMKYEGEGDVFQGTRADHEVHRRVEEVLSKRGRKPKPERWAITCLEEMAVFEKETAEPMQCPRCSGLRVHSRPLGEAGSIRPFKDDGDDILRLWIRTRFAGPHWEPRPIADRGLPAPDFDLIDVGAPREAKVISTLDGSELVDILAGMPRNTAIDVLDAVFIARAYHDPDRRTEQRLTAITKFFGMGGSPIGITLPETPVPDLFDAATLLGPGRAASLMMTYKNGGDDEVRD